MSRILIVRHGPNITSTELPLSESVLDQKAYPIGDESPWRGMEQAGIYKAIHETREGFFYSRVVSIFKEPATHILDKLLHTPFEDDQILCETVGGPNGNYRNFQSATPWSFSCTSRAFNRMAEFNRSFRFDIPQVNDFPIEYRFYGHIKAMCFNAVGLRYEE